MLFILKQNIKRFKMSDNKWLFKNVVATRIEENIDYSDLNSQIVQDEALKNFKVVGSYSWSDLSKPDNPVMVIPSEPGYLAKNLKLQQLAWKKYKYIVDENAFQYPVYPIEPMFRAVHECTPDFDFKSVDLITDRNILRTLFSYADAKFADSWKIDFKRVGNSVILYRSDEKDTVFYEDYSQDFEQKVTTRNPGK